MSLYDNKSRSPDLIFVSLFQLPGLFVIPIWTVFAAAFTTIPSLKVIFFGKNNKSLFTHVEVFGIKLLPFGKITKIITHVRQKYISIFKRERKSMNFHFDHLPIQPIENHLTKAAGISLWVKRDDLIDSEISGNKWRKLQLNIEKFRQKKATRLLTFGGAFSNHILATAKAGALFDIPTIGVIRGEATSSENTTLSRAKEFGMKLHFVSREDYREKTERWFLDHLRKEFGSFYLVPEGGANDLGALGCGAISSEIPFEFSHVVTAAGTGATAVGIASSLRTEQQVLVINALKNQNGLEESIAQILSRIYFDQEMEEIIRSRIAINNDFHFGGFVKFNDDLIDFIREFWRNFRIQLDPIYTGKAMYATFKLIEQGYFKRGTNIVFIHTGGLQGVEGFNQRFGMQLFN